MEPTAPSNATVQTERRATLPMGFATALRFRVFMDLAANYVSTLTTVSPDFEERKILEAG